VVVGSLKTVPTVLFADGTTLTNPSLAQVKQKLAA
jgi:mycoredoxin